MEGRIHPSIVANVLASNIIVSNFKFRPHYYIHFKRLMN